MKTLELKLKNYLRDKVIDLKLQMLHMLNQAIKVDSRNKMLVITILKSENSRVISLRKKTKLRN